MVVRPFEATTDTLKESLMHILIGSCIVVFAILGVIVSFLMLPIALISEIVLELKSRDEEEV